MGYYKLNSEKDKKFLEIIEEDKTFYGGQQKWHGRKSKVINGCGPVSSANILAYLSIKDPKYKNLYSGDFTREDFKNFQLEVYDFISPGLLGLISINKFVNKTLEYAHKKGVDLKYQKLISRNKNFNYLSSYNFIINALLKDLPVAAFNLDPRKNLDFSWHWLVITGIYEENNKIRLIVSSWGKRFDIDFFDYYKSMKFGGGLVYFY